ncbi:MAG: hypothetical protein J7555_08245 [Chloroflexi bacterium]|nr:hypothetical protein [Chloroflexota bacterium]
MLRLVLITFLLAALIAACGPAAVASPAAPQAVQGQVETLVAQTMQAQQTQQAVQDAIYTAVAQTLTAQPTATPLPPTATPLPTQPLVLPTLTPVILPTFTRAPSGGGYVTPSPYSCAVLNKTPADNTVFKPNKDFDVKFWLKNTGTKRWDAGTDLLFSHGTNMLTSNTIYELQNNVPPGGTVGPFIFDAKSPNKEGTYVMVFKLQGGFCYPYVRIVVRP